MIRVSVVLPTYNRLDRLKHVLAGLEAQTVGMGVFEVIVVSDGSEDGTDRYLEGIETSLGLTAVSQPNSGAAAARNRGVNEAKGAIILFIDDDVVPTPTLIEDHLRHHETQDDIIVIGPMLTPPNHTLLPWVAWEQAMLEKQYNAMEAGEWEVTARQFYTGNSSVARHHLLKAGGFDTNFRRAEDVELAYRLASMGLRFVFDAQAIGHHYASRSFESWMGIAYAYGRNDVIFTHQRGQDWLLPAIMREYHSRHPLIKKLTWFCIDRPTLSKVCIYTLKQLAAFATRLSFSNGSAKAYSGIFNLRNYQGMADELGGRDLFFAGIAQGARPTKNFAATVAKSAFTA